jgi:hypothetical protein
MVKVARRISSNKGVDSLVIDIIFATGVMGILISMIPYLFRAAHRGTLLLP